MAAYQHIPRLFFWNNSPERSLWSLRRGAEVAEAFTLHGIPLHVPNHVELLLREALDPQDFRGKKQQASQ